MIYVIKFVIIKRTNSNHTYNYEEVQMEVFQLNLIPRQDNIETLCTVNLIMIAPEPQTHIINLKKLKGTGETNELL